jgi:PEP-CTERM motif
VNVAESLVSNGFWEVYSTVAVPEPGTWIGGSLALAALAFSQRRRLKRLIVNS